MGKIALFGAAGAVGQSVAAALRREGTPYRVVGRSRASLEASFGNDPLAELVSWNPEDPESVRRAATGVDAIIYLVGVAYDQFHLHPVLMRRVLDGAIAAGVERVVLSGTVYPYGRPQTERVKEDHPREPHTFKGRMRKAQEDVLFEADAAGKIRATVLRVPDFYGPGVDKSFLDGAFKAALTGARAMMIGPIDTPHEFAFVPDIGPVLVALSREPRALGRAFNLAGAGVTSQRALAELAFRATGHRFRAFVAEKKLLWALGLFNPMMREFVEMTYLHTSPVLLDDGALVSVLGAVHRTPYEEGVQRTLAALRSAA